MPGRWFNCSDATDDISRQIDSEVTEKKPKNRRRLGRFLLRKPRCNLGIILDISGSGARIQSKEEIEGEVNVMIPTLDHPLCLNARVVWTAELGRKKFESGLEFIDLSDADRNELMLISMSM